MNERAIVTKLRLGIGAGILFTLLYAAQSLFGTSRPGFEAALIISGVAAIVFTASFVYLLTRYVHANW